MHTITAIPAPKVIGPYSRWPRRARRTGWKLPVTALVSATASGIFVHCAMPVLL